MSNAKVRFFGKTRGYSGYGQATKYIAKAFHDSKIPTSFETKEPYFNKLSSYDGACNIDFLIQTPPFSKHNTHNYKIGYFYWEADRLPIAWERDICKSLDEIWVPCELTKNACRKAGFKGPIEIIHTPRPLEVLSKRVSIPAVGSKEFVVDDKAFIFYSIFQWNERKGYRKLLKAYWEEFSKSDDVILVIKTNPIQHKNHGIAKIKHDILSLKNTIRKNDIPPIFLITKFLEDDYIGGLHDLGDCFVLPHHGEGWGMPIHDAMMHDSLVVTTKYGGITESLNSSNSLLIKHKIVNVKPMDWNPYYHEYQNWADPDVGHLKLLMRKAFEMNQRDRLDITRRARSVASRSSINGFSEKIEAIFDSSRFK